LVFAGVSPVDARAICLRTADGTKNKINDRFELIIYPDGFNTALPASHLIKRGTEKNQSRYF
jgi:hypothetical protein